jgi:RNA 3'-terminal phosphate cyclase (ATP)
VPSTRRSTHSPRFTGLVRKGAEVAVRTDPIRNSPPRPGTPFTISRIRAGREKPGLMRQHLTAVNAVAEVCRARVVGAAVGSTELTFEPGEIRAGEYHFSIGTAGSTTMVLQAMLPALMAAKGASRVVVEGGTHARWAPPWEFFDLALVPQIRAMGVAVFPRLERHGFYPAGGGKIVVEIDPLCPAPTGNAPRTPFALHERGDPVARRAKIIHAQLPRTIAEREQAVLAARLGFEPHHSQIVAAGTSRGPGNAVMVIIEHANVTEVCSSIGEHGVSAEAVAAAACTEVETYAKHAAPVGPHLADQLMVPLVAAGGGSFTATEFTQHAITNTQIVRRFVGEDRVRVEESEAGVRWTHE